MSYYAIADKLETILNTVKANGTRLAAVYDTQVPEAIEYPYATISNGDANEKALDNQFNITLYRFIIRVVNIGTDKVAVEATLRQLADEIMAELRKRENQTLGGTVDRFLPYTLTWGWEIGNTPGNRFFEINLEVMKDFSIG